MNREDYIVRVKKTLEDVYTVTDDLDAKGISSQIPFVDVSKGTRTLMRNDILFFIFRIIDTDKIISESGVEFLNEGLGFDFTRLTAEVTRRKAVKSKIPELGFLLPSLVLVDNKLGEIVLTKIYILTLSIVIHSYLMCQDHFSMEEQVNYIRYLTLCKELVENTLGEKLDLDPFDVYSREYADIIKSAIDVDWEINNRKKESHTLAMEKILKEIISDKKCRN